MRAFFFICFALLIAAAAPASAAPPDSIEAQASENYFYIEPGYNGSNVVLFGAVDREKLRGKDFDIAVVLRGPARPVTVWKKGRHAGIWINTDSFTFEGVPNYYAVLSTRPATGIAPLEERKAYGIGLDALSLPVKREGSNGQKSAPQEFQDSLIRLKRSSGLFVERGGDAIEFFGSRLFRSHIYLPAAAGAGRYSVKFYILQNGKVIGETGADIQLKKIGIEENLSAAALYYPWLYGVLAVALAAFIGGGASLVFSRR